MPRLRLPPGPVLALALAAGALLVACGDESAPLLPALPPSDTSVVAQATWDGFYKQQKDRIPEPLVTNPGTPWGSYLGSRSCAGCHAEEFTRWRKSFHSRTLYGAVEGTVLADFSGALIDTDAFDHVTGRPMPAPFIAKAFKETDATGRTRLYMFVRERTEEEGWPRGRARDTYGGGSARLPDVGEGTVQEVTLAFGNRRHQPFVARWRAPGQPLVDGKHFVLPFYWNDVEKRWLYDGFRQYVESCASCHTTGIKSSQVPWIPGQGHFPHTDPEQPRLFNLPPREEGWAEGAVGCEVCHGPGLDHVRAVDRVGPRRYAELRREGKKPPSIFSSRKGSESIERLTKQCDSCHNFNTESSLTLVPGPEGYGRDAPHWPLDPRRDPHFAQFYPDGSLKSPCSIGTLYRTSKMFEKGVHCFDCHDPHGSDHFGSLKLPIEDNSLCLSCHDELSAPEAQAAHSRHKAGSPGNRCVECHMPRHGVFTNGVQMMSDRIHSHAFSIPRGGAGQGAPPTSCNVCHTDRDEAWSAAEIRRLWPAREAPAPAAPAAAPPAAPAGEAPSGR